MKDLATFVTPDGSHSYTEMTIDDGDGKARIVTAREVLDAFADQEALARADKKCAALLGVPSAWDNKEK